MLFGVREVCDVMVKAKSPNQKVGNKTYQAGEPVMHFTSLRASTTEGTSTTVYAQGGKGNPRLIAWDGDRTITFTMEDALLSPIGIALLTGAGFIDSSVDDTLYQHILVTGKGVNTGSEEVPRYRIEVDTAEYEAGIYYSSSDSDKSDYPVHYCKLNSNGDPEGTFEIAGIVTMSSEPTDDDNDDNVYKRYIQPKTGGTAIQEGKYYLVDAYIKRTASDEKKVVQIDISPNQFSGNFYFEGNTLVKDKNGKDYPADLIIPNGKIQSNFAFTLSNTGDPSTFTYTVDAFPGISKNNPTKEVLMSMQITEDADTIEFYPNDEDDIEVDSLLTSDWLNWSADDEDDEEE